MPKESLLIRRPLLTVVMICLAVVVFLIGTYLLRESAKTRIAPAASALAPLLPSPTTPLASLPEAEAEDNIALRSHWKAIERCYGEGRVPVMGYNYGVICLHKANVAWTQYDKLPF